MSTRRFDSLAMMEHGHHVANALWLTWVRLSLCGNQISLTVFVFGRFGAVVKVPNEPHNYITIAYCYSE